MNALAPQPADAGLLVRLTLLSLIILGTVCLGTAGYACFFDADFAHNRFRASATIVLAAAGLLMMDMALGMLRKLHRRMPLPPIVWRRLGRAMFVGTVWSYWVALAVGPQPGVLYVFIAALAAWTCGVTWWQVVEVRSRHLNKRPRHRLAARVSLAAVYWMSITFVAAEATLRIVSLWETPWGVSDRRASMSLPEAPAFHTAMQTFATRSAALPMSASTANFRIAALGNSTTLAGYSSTHCLAELERLLPCVALQNCSGPTAGEGEFMRRFTRETAAQQPDLLLLFLAVDRDLLSESSCYSPFDFNSLHLVKALQSVLGYGALAAANPACGELVNTDKRQQFLRACTARLAVCRVPLEPMVLQRWNATLLQLDELGDHCQKTATPLAIVLVPAEFQVNPRTLEALCRRSGCTAQQVDLELPQRRLAAYAAARQIPLVDLLPHFRAAKESPYRRHSGDWTETGHAIAAEAIVQFVRSRYGSTFAAANKP